MASLEKRSGNYRIVYYFNGKKFSRSLKTRNKRLAERMLFKIEDGLERYRLGLLEIPKDSDHFSVLVSDGQIQRPKKLQKHLTLNEVLSRYLASIPERALEANTVNMLKTHIGHLKRLIGANTVESQVDLVGCHDLTIKRMR